jgi:hypothetical protein
MGMGVSHKARDEHKTLIPIPTLFEALTGLKNHYNFLLVKQMTVILFERRGGTLIFELEILLRVRCPPHITS